MDPTRLAQALRATPSVTQELLAEIAGGEGIGLAAAARLLPGRGAARNPSTLWRWARRGVKNQGGYVVRLEVAVVGARYATSSKAVSRFLAALNGAPLRSAEPAIDRTQRLAEVEEACERFGL